MPGAGRRTDTALVTFAITSGPMTGAAEWRVSWSGERNSATRMRFSHA